MPSHASYSARKTSRARGFVDARLILCRSNRAHGPGAVSRLPPGHGKEGKQLELVAPGRRAKPRLILLWVALLKGRTRSRLIEQRPAL